MKETQKSVTPNNLMATILHDLSYQDLWSSGKKNVYRVTQDLHHQQYHNAQQECLELCTFQLETPTPNSLELTTPNDQHRPQIASKGRPDKEIVLSMETNGPRFVTYVASSMGLPWEDDSPGAVWDETGSNAWPALCPGRRRRGLKQTMAA